MTDYPQRVSSSWNERMRLIRLRRKKENLRFWQEFGIIPGWLKGFVAFLYVVALVVAISINLHAAHNPNGNEMAPWELRDNPALASLAVAGMVSAVSLVLAIMIFFVAYVNRDASRRGMSAALWTLLVLILMPSLVFVGFVIYFLMREPLPYPCPQCGNSVGPRFNFCPTCKCNLHPSCPQCKREVAETDKFCPYCAYELGANPPVAAQPLSNQQPL